MSEQAAPRRIGVTGSSGYIGSALLAQAVGTGIEVVALGRRAVQGAQAWRKADLATRPAPCLLDGLDGVVHLAAETGGKEGVGTAAECAFAVALARDAAARGIPCVVVSSQAANEHAPSGYGRRKAAIERAVLPLGAVVVRPGLVVGGPRAGLQGQLRALARELPVLPRLWPPPLVQPVHVNDLADALMRALVVPALAGKVLAVAGPPLALHALLEGFARHDARRRCVWSLPVPVAVLRWLLALGAMVVGPRFAPERLDSLLALPLLDAEADLSALGVRLRPIVDALDRRGGPTRQWLREADALAQAVLGRAAPPFSLRLYVRLSCRRPGGRPLQLPPGLLDRPAYIAAVDLPGRRRDAAATLGGRLALMTRVLEATPSLADAFLARPGEAGCWRFMIAMMRATAVEAMARLRRPFALRLLAAMPKSEP